MTGGRPRDPRVDEVLTQHLVRLLAERGPDGFTVEELATSSGIGKASIYRRYRSREDLVEAGFAAVNVDMPDVSDLPVREALIAFLTWGARSHLTGMTPVWLTGMTTFPNLRDLYIERVVEPRRQRLRAVLQRGQQQGLLRPDLDLDVALMCLSAPAVVVGMHRARLDDSEMPIEKIVDTVLGGILCPEPTASTRATD